MPINGAAATAVGVGSLLLWSGVKGWQFTRAAGEIISGRVPSGPEAYALTSGDTSGGFAGGSGNALAAEMLAHQGHAYLYGGAPGKDGSKPWDCSSSINWCASKLGYSIPGYPHGSYDGSSHGPPTGVWGVWPGLRKVNGFDNVQAGDVIIWFGHMGIALGPNQMISALDSKDRTKVTPIKGYGNGPLLKIGRYGG